MNKKIISFVTAFFMMFSLLDFPASVHAETVNGCIIEGDTLTGYSSYSGGSNAIVPDGIKHIADTAFYYSKVTSVTLPEGIETIGIHAFWGCYNMTSINLPDSITFIGEGAFKECRGLTSLHIPDSVKTIGGHAFRFCENLQTVNIPNGIETIEDCTFIFCRKLSSIEIPDSVKTIGGHAFGGCMSLSSVTIPDSVKIIGDGAFNGTSVESVTIPDSVTYIGQGSFIWCDDLKKVFYPDAAEKTGAFPANADRIAYKTNGDGSVTVTNIEPAGDNRAAEIPDTINGLPVASVDESVRNKVSESGHTHNLTKTDRKEPTCTEEGSIEYWTCSICGTKFSNAEGTTVITDTVIPKKAHTLEKTEEKAATCTENGNITYWTCSVCKKTFSDENGSTEITNTVISKTGHSMTHTERKAPTCINDGNIEYWTCSNCHKYFSDAAGTYEIALNDTVLTATGIHNYADGVCTVCGAKAPDYSEPTETSPSETDIQGDSGKSGWDAISDIISDTPDGGIVTVDMNNTDLLPKDIISQIKGRDIDLVLIMKNKFVWTINGTSVRSAKTVNMKVQRSVNISASTVDEYFGDLETVQIQLVHNGDFGFTAELSISLGSRYNGMTASSYCYKANKFTFSDSAEIADGRAKLKFDHASNWLIAITDADAAEDVSSDAGMPAEGDTVEAERSVSLLFLIVVPLLGAAFACFKKSRQR